MDDTLAQLRGVSGQNIQFSPLAILTQPERHGWFKTQAIGRMNQQADRLVNND